MVRRGLLILIRLILYKRDTIICIRYLECPRDAHIRCDMVFHSSPYSRESILKSENMKMESPDPALGFGDNFTLP